ncbi:unnamed protein product [Durusdinium trenchii]|uniref:Uncharacterized protein n=1 Tax=Durusdinium trenchii TaxID=1381693 RepID=A0ABP0LNP4_9DINO
MVPAHHSALRKQSKAVMQQSESADDEKFYLACIPEFFQQKMAHKDSETSEKPLRVQRGKAPQDLMLSLQQTRRLQQEEQEERMD